MNIRTWMCNREILSEKLAQGYTAKPLWKIFFGVLLLLNLAFLGVTLMKGINDNKYGNDMNVHLDYTEFAFSRLQTFTETLQFLNTMVLINFDAINTRNRSKTEVLGHLMKSLVYTLDETYTGINQLHNLRSADLNHATKDRFSKPITPQLLPNARAFEYYNLATASHMYYRLFQRVTEYDPSLVSPYDEITLSIYINSFNIYSAFSANANDFIEELFSSVAGYSSSLDFYILIISIYAICSILIIVVLIVIIQKDRVKSLSCFLTISLRKIEKHSKSIENFIIFMKNRSATEAETETGADYERGEIRKVTLKKELQPSTRGNCNKQYTYSCGDICSKILRFIILYLLIECYFIGLYAVQKNWATKLELIKPEYNSTGQASTFYGISFISMMASAMNLDGGMWNSAIQVYLSDENFHLNRLAKNHILYGKDLSESYNQQFQDVTEGNLCKYLESPIGSLLTKSECEQIFHGALKQGLFAAITYFKSFINREERRYITLSEIDPELLDSPEYTNKIDTGETFYYPFLFPELIRPALNHMRKCFKNSLNDYIESMMKIQEIVLIIFLMAIIIFQALYGISAYFENQWLKKIAHTIAIIPPSMSVNNKAMVDFVKGTIGK